MKHPILPDIELYKTTRRPRLERQVGRVEEYLSPPKGSKILEIGSGEGLVVAALAINGYDAYGVDPTDAYVANAREVLKLNSIEKGKVKQGFAENLPFPDNSFDYVISFQTLEHVQDLTRTFKEIERVLRPGGETFHICPNYKRWSEGHYHVVKPPFMGKKSFRIYIFCLRRLMFWRGKKWGAKLHFPDTGHSDAVFIESLNFITPDTVVTINETLSALVIKNETPNILTESKLGRKIDWQWTEQGNSKVRFLKKVFFPLARIGGYRLWVSFVIKMHYYSHLYIKGRKENVKN